MDGVPISLAGMTIVVSSHSTFYLLILTFQNITDHVVVPPVRSGDIQNHAFY